MDKKTLHQEQGRKLSVWRVLLAIVLVAGLGLGGFKWFDNWRANQNLGSLTPWYGPYVDVTATPRYAFEQLAENQIKNVVLAFIVSDLEEPCTPSWGGFYTLDEAGNELDLDRRIERFRQQEGDVVVSFGGLINDELADKCSDENKLMQSYKAVVERYGLSTLDFDIESDSITNQEALERRARVVAKLQSESRANNKPLAVWVTLPMATFGLTPEGANVVSVMLNAGVDLAGVNVMTMNYGQSKEPSESVGLASERGLLATHRQLGILYKQAGINLTSASLWAKLGATPMIGQNDIAQEIFYIDDAIALNKFATFKGMMRMSMWSANRDIECGGNYVNVRVVSDSCSGVDQERMDFSKTLMESFGGTIENSAGVETSTDAIDESALIDVPEESPYQIWSETGTYLTGTKVVWRRNVYQAKWWTKGDLPDNPVLQTWETPWQLIGPVLPGEKPIPLPTLPADFYPEWSGTVIYQAGDRVIFMNSSYEAKWWTQGDSPAAANANADSSPWMMLTREEIEALLENQKEK